MIIPSSSGRGFGDLLPCCDNSMSILDQVFSNTCSYCFGSPQEASVPVCDPNGGLVSSVFSNSCNVPVNQALSEAVGLPTLPAWVWWGGLGIVGFLAMRGGR